MRVPEWLRRFDNAVIGLVREYSVMILRIGLGIVFVWAQNLGRVLTREQLLEAAWPDPQAVDDARTVDVHVRRVRVALGTAASLTRLCTASATSLWRRRSVPAAAL